MAGNGINKAILLVGSRVYGLTDNGQLHKVNTSDMSKVWVYTAGAATSTPAAYSANSGLVVFCTADLYVHAVHDADGSVKWRVKPTSQAAQSP
jgi:outer membrane protein assembly factor BamB